jgi:putative endopeptidase
VKPGDSFYDYCNGTWLKLHPFPAPTNVGGLYDLSSVMEERVKQLRASVPDLGHYYDLMEHMHDQPEKSQAYIDEQKARFPKPATKEEAFLTMGRMIADGVAPEEIMAVPAFYTCWKDGKVVGLIVPPGCNFHIDTMMNPGDLFPLSQTLAEEYWAYPLVVKGMGLSLSQFVLFSETKEYWKALQNRSLEEICQILDGAWDAYEMYVSPDEMTKVHQEKTVALNKARASLNYTISYYFAEAFVSSSHKQHILSITKEIQQSLRHRLEQVDWMSETTRNNALEKLDNYGLFVAKPDEWHTDCVSSYENCETLVEAVHINMRNIARLRAQLLGGKDLFSCVIVQNMMDSNMKIVPCDLTLVNAMYEPTYNSIFIFPSLLLPPFLPTGVSDACSYAVFTFIGHEFTHGFDTFGAEYDKDGYKHNWWTVADQMAFEDRRENIIQCYNHMEMDPDRAPGVYGDGTRTQTENIADLGGFLAVLDAYKALLEREGYIGQLYDNQLRKFFECVAHLWCVQYDETKFDILVNADVHSHARLRVNGMVMNTDLWYELYNVDRNNYLYLPPKRRAYIW